LEVDVLDDDPAAPAGAPVATTDERPRLTVLVVAAEADFRRYVRECLRERADLRFLESATAAGAVALASDYSPRVLVVDEPESAVVETLGWVPAIVIVDDVPHGEPRSASRRLLARPFTADGLLAELDQLLERVGR